MSYGLYERLPKWLCSGFVFLATVLVVMGVSQIAGVLLFGYLYPDWAMSLVFGMISLFLVASFVDVTMYNGSSRKYK